MKPYPEYKPTALAWLPEIPKHWKLVRAKQLFFPVDQRSDTGSEELLSVSERFGVVKRSSANVTMFMAASYQGYKLCWPDDLAINSLWAWSYGLGFSKYHGIISTAYSVFRLKDKERCLPRFYDYFVRSQAFHWELRVRSKGLWKSRYQLSDDSFLAVPMILPPADEQAQIVRYLDAMTAKINKLIRAKKRQIALLQEQKQAIINQAVTRGLDPDVELKDSGIDWLGPIPKQWEIKTVKQYFKIRKQIAGHEGYDVLSITQDGIKIKDISTNEGQMAMSYAGYQLVRPGDFAMNHMDLLTGYVDRSNYFGVTSPDYRVFELCDNANCHPDFFLYVFQLYYKRRIFYRYGRGAASVGRWRLPAREFLNFVIPVPPIISQKRIVKFVKNNTQNIDKNILAVESQIKILSEYKNSLIAAVVTGKVDVRNIAVEAAPPEDLAPSDDPDESEEQDSPVSEESEE